MSHLPFTSCAPPVRHRRDKASCWQRKLTHVPVKHSSRLSTVRHFRVPNPQRAAQKKGSDRLFPQKKARKETAPYPERFLYRQRAHARLI